MKQPSIYDNIPKARSILKEVGVNATQQASLMLSRALLQDGGQTSQEDMVTALKSVAGRLKDGLGLKKVDQLDPVALMFALGAEHEAHQNEVANRVQEQQALIQSLFDALLPRFQEELKEGRPVADILEECEKRVIETIGVYPAALKAQVEAAINDMAARAQAASQAPAAEPSEEATPENNQE